MEIREPATDALSTDIVEAFPCNANDQPLSYLERWRTSRCDILGMSSPVVLLPDELKSFMDSDEFVQFSQMQPAHLWLNIDQVKHLVIAPAFIDLEHVGHALASRFGMKHHRVTVGAAEYERFRHERDFNETVQSANQYSVQLHRLHEDPREAELSEMKVNWFGYLFTYQRLEFWKRSISMHLDLRRDFVTFGLEHTPKESSLPLSQLQYEEAHVEHNSLAYARQEEYDDNDDNSDLMFVIRRLRRFVNPTQ